MQLFQANVTSFDGIFNDVEIKFTPEFEGLRPQDKLNFIQDALYELNKKWKEVDETL